MNEKIYSDFCTTPEECDYEECGYDTEGVFQPCHECKGKDWNRDYWYGPAGNSLEEAITHTKEAFQDICKKNKVAFLGDLDSVCWEAEAA